MTWLQFQKTSAQSIESRRRKKVRKKQTKDIGNKEGKTERKKKDNFYFCTSVERKKKERKKERKKKDNFYFYTSVERKKERKKE